LVGNSSGGLNDHRLQCCLFAIGAPCYSSYT
jgi:hypothetical protein